jgi:hypothetical protein
VPRGRFNRTTGPGLPTSKSYNRQNRMEIKSLYSGGLITNYFCSSKCGHCLYNCGPELKKNYIKPEKAEAIFEKLFSLRCRSVHIGGGEPLLRPAKLLEIAKLAKNCGIGIEYIETNSSWYKDHESACSMISGFMDAGVHTLLTSISPFHNEYIPFAKVKGVITACSEVGMGVFPWIAEFAEDIAHFDTSKTHSLREYDKYFGEGYSEELIRRYSLTMKGRPLDTFRGKLPESDTQNVLEGAQEGCGNLENTSHFHIDLYGNYIPGLCTGLSIDSNDLGGELSDEEYPILNILYEKGINGLFEYACKNYNFKPREKYISKCDICCDIRSFLVKDCEIRTKELQPIEFYS